MRQFLEKYRTLFWTTVLVLAGFLVAGAAVQQSSRTILQRNLTDQMLPLASDALRADIRAKAIRPGVIASALANDSVLRDWLASGESDSAAIARYLSETRERHGALAAFLVSNRTLNAYAADGTLKQLQESDPADAWFFRMRATSTPSYTTTGIAKDNTVVHTVHHRIVDRDGNLLGVVGIAMPVDGLAGLVENQERHPGRHVFLIDAQGKVALAGNASDAAGHSIDQLPGLNDMTRSLLHGGEGQVVLQHRQDGNHAFVSTRFIPELGWHLLVTQDSVPEFRPAIDMFLLTLTIGTVVVVAMLAMLVPAVNRLHRRLEAMAGADALTCLLNRQAFDIIFRQAMLDADRSGHPLSAILFDLDFFRKINETYGDYAGDEVLRRVAQITQALIRESDVLARWGGEEFIVLLKDCPLEQAVSVAEKLRAEIDSHDFAPAAPDHHVTVSLGVAQHELGEAASMLLRRADEALCKAKANGRNRLHVARTGGWSESPGS